MLIRALFLLEFVWLTLLAINPTGWQILAFGNPLNWFSDFYMVKAQSLPSVSWTTWQAADRSMNPLFLLLFRPFPATAWGALAQLAMMNAAFYAAILAFARRQGLGLLKGVAFCLTLPCVFNFERANTLPLAAAGVILFLLWKDSPRRRLRIGSYLLMGLVISLKLSPGAFALTLLFERRWRAFAMVMIVAMLGLTLPFAFVADGIHDCLAQFASMFHNGVDKSGSWGFTYLWRCAAHVIGVDESVGNGLLVARLLDISLSFFLLVGVAWRRVGYDRLFALAAFALLLPQNAMHYCGMYLVAPAILYAVTSCEGSRFCRFSVLVSWLLVLSPLQISGLSTGMRPIADLAFLALCVSVCLRDCSQRLEKRFSLEY